MIATARSLAQVGLVLAFFVGAARAQNIEANKVGIVNLPLLFEKCEKRKSFEREIADDLGPLRVKADKIVIALKSRPQHHIWPPNSEAEQRAESEFRANLQALEEVTEQARKLIAEKRERRIAQLHAEIRDAVAAYGKQKGLDLVLGHGKLPTADPEDPWHFVRPAEKTTLPDQADGEVMYVREGFNITDEVIRRLPSATGNCRTLLYFKGQPLE
jgi:Skp family chaperone for outer membrane proteins